MQAEKIPIQPPQGIPSKMVVGYLNRCLSALPDVKAALDRSDHGFTPVFGHRLKGTGGAYGVPALSEIGVLIEEASIRRDTAAVLSQVAALEEYLGRIEIVTGRF